VFDSCYSGGSIKSLLSGTVRSLPPEALNLKESGQDFASYDSQILSNFGQFTQREARYPYQSLIYLSAASKAEPAIDISTSLLRAGTVQTIDGKPHGALTNAVLFGLSGAADTDHNRQVTYQELYAFVRQMVSKQFPHTPQLLFPPDRPDLAAAPVFHAVALAYTLPSSTTGPSGTIRVNAGAVVPELSEQIARLPFIVVSSSGGDLFVRQSLQGWELFHGSGTRIGSYTFQQRSDLLDRIAAEPALRRLTDLTYSRQDFNITLEPHPSGRGFYLVGDILQFFAKAGTDCWPLLVNVDVSGAVTLLHPAPGSPTSLLKGGVRAPLGSGGRVASPTGTEYLKLFAFRSKPAALDEFLVSWGDKPVLPASKEFRRLLDLVSTDMPGRAQVWIKLVTTER
jgi:hypothetical protein